MKKLVFIIFFAIITPLFATTVFAQETTISLTPIPTISPAPTSIEYTMPYPGLLPTNPLYKLKTFRDKVIGLLISDPLKKAEFDLLQADKRVAASWYLLKANPKEAVVVGETFSKADNYFDEGIQQLSLAKQQGENVNDMTERFIKSNMKHLEMLHLMQQSATGNVQKTLTVEEQRIEVFDKRVNPTSNIVQ